MLFSEGEGKKKKQGHGFKFLQHSKAVKNRSFWVAYHTNVCHACFLKIILLKFNNFFCLSIYDKIMDVGPVRRGGGRGERAGKTEDAGGVSIITPFCSNSCRRLRRLTLLRPRIARAFVVEQKGERGGGESRRRRRSRRGGGREWRGGGGA